MNFQNIFPTKKNLFWKHLLFKIKFLFSKNSYLQSNMGFYNWWLANPQIYSVYMAGQSLKRLKTQDQKLSKELQIPEMFHLLNGTFRWRVESDGLPSVPESGFHNSLQVKSEPEFVNILEEPRNRFPAYSGPVWQPYFYVTACLATQAGRIDPKAIPGLPKRLQIRALV